MQTFPVMLNLIGRQAVVVGAGAVARRKVRALRQAGAIVRLISPDEVGDVGEGVEVLTEAYHPEHLAGAVLVFACTDDRAANSRIAADARRSGALVCAVDQPGDCDFFSPAVARDGEVILAVGTGGAAPSLARRLAEKLQTALPERIGAFAACLHSLRDELQAASLPADRRRAVLDDLASEETYNAFLAEGLPAVRRRLEALSAPQGDLLCD
ncbi:MAG: bifunctional precorrin-2 dehydrogenase/sirohydrochlorin ferrochelatase [Phycisphaerae bacterium]|nr:bifunctional precorrin-2 dehydrogenase/sirohydrochlorin ferrochelatase [Phycisphaerae bacterium]